MVCNNGMTVFENILLFCMPAIYELATIGVLPNNVMYVPLIIMLIYEYIIKGKRPQITKKYLLFGALMALAYIFSSLLSFELMVNDVMYVILIFAMFFSLPVFGDIMSKNILCATRLLYLGNAVVLYPLLCMNVSKISFAQILNSLAVDGMSRFGRNYFGFYHPNTAALMIVTQIVLSVILVSKSRKLMEKIVVSIIILPMIICLLSAGSRTAVIAVFLLFFLLFIFKSLKFTPHFRFITYLVIVCAAVIVAINTDVVNMLIYNSSGRFYSTQLIVKEMNNQGRLLFGIGVHQISSGSISRILGGIFIVDNWYVYMFVSTGIIGFVSIVFGLVYYFRVIIKDTPVSQNRFLIRALIACLLVYGLAENVVFVPGVLYSIITWILLEGLSLSDE
ncbi:MAG: hypothetical protein K6F92_04455 [Lachnospiraceae bacterium]|nr:hypothetical protein [Lachnospiraceae bacterium]